MEYKRKYFEYLKGEGFNSDKQVISPFGLPACRQASITCVVIKKEMNKNGRLQVHC
jgi:hypothetical protein